MTFVLCGNHLDRLTLDGASFFFSFQGYGDVGGIFALLVIFSPLCLTPFNSEGSSVLECRM